MGFKIVAPNPQKKIFFKKSLIISSISAENAHSAADAEDAINTAKRLHKFVEDCGELDEWLRERGTLKSI